jgi:hypothetical protein
MKNEKEKTCFKCHSTRLLRECRSCGTVACTNCAVVPSVGVYVQELPKYCIKCGSEDVILLEHTFVSE